MTKRELLDLLSPYPDDTPILDGRGFDLRASSIDERQIDDWQNKTEYINPDDGATYDVPGRMTAVSIGPRF